MIYLACRCISRGKLFWIYILVVRDVFRGYYVYFLFLNSVTGSLGNEQGLVEETLNICLAAPSSLFLKLPIEFLSEETASFLF